MTAEDFMRLPAMQQVEKHIEELEAVAAAARALDVESDREFGDDIRNPPDSFDRARLALRAALASLPTSPADTGSE